MRPPDDLTGKRFGKLVVLSLDEPYMSPSGVRKYTWKCACDCGNTCVVRGDYLRRGQRLHCSECPPLPRPKRHVNQCRSCEYLEIGKQKEWICRKGLDPKLAKHKCSGYWCASEDKLNGLKHKNGECLICGKPIYSNSNSIPIYCEQHRAYAERDSKILQEAPVALLFGLIASIFTRARDDYLFDTAGYKKDAEEFFRSEWAEELSMGEFNADEVLKRLDEVINNGLDFNREDF